MNKELDDVRKDIAALRNNYFNLDSRINYIMRNDTPYEESENNVSRHEVDLLHDFVAGIKKILDSSVVNNSTPKDFDFYGSFIALNKRIEVVESSLNELRRYVLELSLK